jgi:hypothetical protein
MAMRITLLLFTVSGLASSSDLSQPCSGNTCPSVSDAASMIQSRLHLDQGVGFQKDKAAAAQSDEDGYAGEEDDEDEEDVAEEEEAEDDAEEETSSTGLCSSDCEKAFIKVVKRKAMTRGVLKAYKNAQKQIKRGKGPLVKKRGCVKGCDETAPMMAAGFEDTDEVPEPISGGSGSGSDGSGSGSWFGKGSGSGSDGSGSGSMIQNDVHLDGVGAQKDMAAADQNDEDGYAGEEDDEDEEEVAEEEEAEDDAEEETSSTGLCSSSCEKAFIKKVKRKAMTRGVKKAYKNAQRQIKRGKGALVKKRGCVKGCDETAPMMAAGFEDTYEAPEPISGGSGSGRDGSGGSGSDGSGSGKGSGSGSRSGKGKGSGKNVNGEDDVHPRPFRHKHDNSYCSNRGGIAGNTEFSKNVGLNNVKGCASYVRSIPECGPWFNYGSDDGWCDCVKKSDGECVVAGHSGYTVYKMKAEGR